MASCVKNIHAKNYQNLIIGFQVTVKNVGNVSFWDTAYRLSIPNTARKLAATVSKGDYRAI